MDRFAVFGNPIAHSKSPQIHQAFAGQRNWHLSYERIQATAEQFPEAVAGFFASGGKGANVTLPLKEIAFSLCDHVSKRASEAGAVNTLWQHGDKLHGDNTDGAGLLADLRTNLGWQLKDRRILVLGAGGAVRGVLGPLLTEGPAELMIANRTLARAEQLKEQFRHYGVSLYAQPLEALHGQFDLVINAISAGLHGEMPALDPSLLATGGVCYDMLYSSSGETPFLNWAQMNGAVACSDGLGMLVEQAAEAFYLWHSWRPHTAEVITGLRRNSVS